MVGREGGGEGRSRNGTLGRGREAGCVRNTDLGEFLFNISPMPFLNLDWDSSLQSLGTARPELLSHVAAWPAHHGYCAPKSCLLACCARAHARGRPL